MVSTAIKPETSLNMQRITLHTLFALCSLFLVWGCEKDEQQLVLQPQGTITATPSSTSVILTSTGSATNALGLSWTPVDYGVPVAVNYAVQFDKVGNQFKAPVEISAGTSTSLSITGADLNAALLKLGLVGGTPGQVEMRVRAGINRPNDQPGQFQYSAATVLNATPITTISFLYVPGAYQNWAPENAPSLISPSSDGNYEGYIYVGAASEFKITSVPAWNGTTYGVGATADKLSTTGDNLKIATPGYYYFRVNTTNLTWSAVPTKWGVIGAATPTNWEASTPMTYDPTSGTWKLDVALKQDELKFRANDAWDLNFGDNEADGILEAGGANIKVPSAGNYTVELDLRKAGSYTYKLTKKQ